MTLRSGSELGWRGEAPEAGVGQPRGVGCSRSRHGPGQGGFFSLGEGLTAEVRLQAALQQPRV